MRSSNSICFMVRQCQHMPQSFQPCQSLKLFGTSSACATRGKIKNEIRGKFLLNSPSHSFSANHHNNGIKMSGCFRQMSVKILADREDVTKFLSENDRAVLYFTATWCPPCKAIAPIYEKLSTKYESDGIGFAKIDVDENSDSSVDYNVNAVPTFVLSRKKIAVEQFSGADAAKLEKLIEGLKKK